MPHMHMRICSFWFYGDDDPTKRLALLDSFLSEFEARPVHSAVATQVSEAVDGLFRIE